MDYLINNNLKIKENKDFILEAKRINLKLKKLIKKPIFIKRKIEKTHILYIDDTHHEEKAFKVRGAYSEIINNFNRIKKKNNTIVLASTGNFAQAISNICIKKKINCVVFLTKLISKKKLQNLKQRGVKVFLCKDYEVAKTKARNYSKKNNFFFSDGCNKNIFLGNASMMLEAINELKKNKKISKKKILGIFPLGNGSLAAPSSVILKNKLANIDIACVEPFNFKKSQKILENKIVLNLRNTIADGAAIKKLPNESKKIIFQNCKYFFSVTEKEIKESMKFIFKNLQIISEGAGALANALLLTNPNFMKKYYCVIVPICGGNIEKTKLLAYIKK